MEVNLLETPPWLICAHFVDFEKSGALATEFQSPASAGATARSLTDPQEPIQMLSPVPYPAALRFILVLQN